MVRDWLGDSEFASALEAMLAERSPEARDRLVELARRAGAPSDAWRGFRNGDVLIFREQTSTDALALVVDGRAGRVRLVPAAEVDSGGEVAVTNLDEALDDAASPVLAWLRARGEMPGGASRLAALFEPRRRGTAWPSSQT